MRSCLAVLAWFTAHPAYDAPHRDAILRSMWVESRYEACAVSRDRSSAYLLQWLGPRRRALEVRSGARCPPVEAQLDFMESELTGPWRRFLAVRTEAAAYAYLRRCYGAGRCR